MIGVSVSECEVDDVTAVATRWLAVATDLGWGMEGPRHAERIQRRVETIACGGEGDDPDLIEIIKARELGTRPVDALFEAAGLLIEAHGEAGTHHGELLSAARGWLQVAVRRAP